MNANNGRVVTPSTVRFERVLPGPIEKIWGYVTQSDLRGQWLAPGAWDLRVGGRIELAFKHADLSPHRAPAPAGMERVDDEGHIAVGEILAIDAPRSVTITWSGGSEVTFDLTPAGEDVLLTITHTRLSDAQEMRNVSGGWHAHLSMLEDRANGRTPPAFWTAWAGVKDRYATIIP